MRAITVKQPWASCITEHGPVGSSLPRKTTENRGRMAPWHLAVGERLAVHAGKGWDRPALLDPRVQPHLFGIDGLDAGAVGFLAACLPTGAVLGTAVLADVHLAADTADGEPCCLPWGAPDQWHLVLDDVVALSAPVPCNGALGLWSLPADVERLAHERTAVAA